MTTTTKQDRTAPADAAYDAFVSYSHAADGRLAPGLQHALQTMAKPWYRRRALRIFRDQTSLSASPELWGSIERALGSSRTFVLLAAPESAASPWVEQEAAWWRAHRAPRDCLIVLTGGELRWDASLADFSAHSAVPPSLRGWFAAEPLWVDLRWARTEEHLSLRNPRFRDAVADLAAPLHGVAKDALVGEDIRLHRRAMRLARAAVASLVVFLAVAAVAAVIAVAQRNSARDSSSLATARQIAATATGAFASRLDLAGGLSAEAYARRRTPQTEAALFGAVTASPHLVRFRSAGSRVTALAPVAAGGDEVLVGDAGGRVRAWSLGDGRFGPVLLRTRGPVSVIRPAPAGDVLAVGDERGDIVVRSSRDGALRRLRIGQRVADVAIDDAGSRLAAAGAAETASLSLFDLRTRALERRIGPRLLPGAVRFDAGGRLLVVGSTGGAQQRFTVPRLAPVGARTYDITPANGSAQAYSPDRRFFGMHKFGMRVIDTTGATPDRDFPLDTATAASAVAIAPDARRVAVAAGGTVSVLRPERKGDRFGLGADAGGLAADPMTGLSSDVTAMTFVAGGRVVTAAGDVLGLWAPAQRSRAARRLPAPVRDVYDLESPPALALSDDGRSVASVGEDDALRISDARTGRPASLAALRSGLEAQMGVVLDRHARTATVLDQDADLRPTAYEIDLASGARRGSLRLGAEPSALVPGPRGRPLVVYDDGSIGLLELDAGRARKLAGALPGQSGGVFRTAVAVVPRTGVAYEAAGGRLWAVDVATGRASRWATPGAEGTTAVAASADGRLVATTDRQTSVRVWDATSHRLVRTLDTSPVSSLALDGDGSHLAAVQRNGTMSVWRPRDAARLGEVPLTDAEAGREVSAQTTAVFAPDGTLWTATAGSGLYAWTMSPRRWTAIACATIGRPLTRDEWRRYLGIPYAPRSPC